MALAMLHAYSVQVPINIVSPYRPPRIGSGTGGLKGGRDIMLGSLQCLRYPCLQFAWKSAEHACAQAMSIGLKNFHLSILFMLNTPLIVKDHPAP